MIDYGRVLLTVECSAVCLLAPTDTHVIVKSRPHNGRPVKHAAVPLRSLVTTVSCYGTLLLIIIIRPPGTLVPKAFCFSRDVF